jgi:hypothetical protein
VEVDARREAVGGCEAVVTFLDVCDLRGFLLVSQTNGRSKDEADSFKGRLGFDMTLKRGVVEVEKV